MANPTLIPFKMFGLQRSGTNLMVALMVENFHVHSLEAGGEWKHGPLLMPDRSWNGEPARFVLCVKNPYAWAVSCYRYFQRAHQADPTVAPQFRLDPSMSFEEFVTGPGYGFARAIARWNLMYRLWLSTLPPDRTALVRQEDQLEDQVRVLETVQRHLGLTPRAPQLRSSAQKVDLNARRVGPMDRGYYLDGRYMAEYSPLILERVTIARDERNRIDTNRDDYGNGIRSGFGTGL